MNKDRVQVSVTTAIPVGASFALTAVETILKEFSQVPGSASLALSAQELHLPFEAFISVPVNAQVRQGEGRNQWRLRISAASKAAVYPEFDGVLTLVPAGRGAQLELDGTYALPLGAIGRAIDATVFAGAAQSSLRRFVRGLAGRVTALTNWARAVQPLGLRFALLLGLSLCYGFAFEELVTAVPGGLYHHGIGGFAFLAGSRPFPEPALR